MKTVQTVRTVELYHQQDSANSGTVKTVQTVCAACQDQKEVEGIVIHEETPKKKKQPSEQRRYAGAYHA